MFLFLLSFLFLFVYLGTENKAGDRNRRKPQVVYPEAGRRLGWRNQRGLCKETKSRGKKGQTVKDPSVNFALVLCGMDVKQASDIICFSSGNLWIFVENKEGQRQKCVETLDRVERVIPWT